MWIVEHSKTSQGIAAVDIRGDGKFHSNIVRCPLPNAQVRRPNHWTTEPPKLLSIHTYTAAPPATATAAAAAAWPRRKTPGE